MIHGSSDMECNGQNFLPFYPLSTRKIKILKKWKKRLEISFYKSVPKIVIICYTVTQIRHVTNLTVIFHFRLFFALLPPFYLQKIKIKKK